MKPATAGAPYRVPPEPSRLPAFLLAVAVHAVLLGFLWFGISWQTSEPVAVEAEVWDMSVQTAAAPELPPPPAPEPEPEPEPVAPPPRAVEPPPVERPAPTPPDIKLQREKELKERKEREQRELAEKKERERKEEEAREKKLAEQKKKEEAEREKKELAKKEAEQKKKEEAERKQKELAEAKKKAAAEKAEAAKLEKLRQDELKRIAGAMGSTGSAAKSTAPKADAGYVAAITAAIKSNTAYGGSTTMPGNPKAIFKVEQLPTGEIMSVRLVKSSGVPEFDRAVENGIKKASPLPKKKDGTVERTLDVNFSMKDYD
jgi:colicin import membrane protein